MSNEDEYYCGVCQRKYTRYQTQEVDGIQRDIYDQDYPDILKDTVRVIFIQCLYRHTIGAKDIVATNDNPF